MLLRIFSWQVFTGLRNGGQEAKSSQDHKLQGTSYHPMFQGLDGFMKYTSSNFPKSTSRPWKFSASFACRGRRLTLLPRGKPAAWPVVQGWRHCLERITWYKILKLISYLSYHNQMDNLCAGEEWSFCMSQRPRLSSIKISGDLSSVATKEKQLIICKNIFLGVAKRWRPVTQGWHLPPHDYGRAPDDSKFSRWPCVF